MMFKRDNIRVAACAALLAAAVCLPAMVRADAISPDTILAAPTQYDTQSITVTGTAKNVTTHQGRRGPMTRYDLCATACIHVTDFTGTAVAEGAATTATGTFHAHVVRGSYSIDNALFVGAPARGLGASPQPAPTASP
jgi:hypothetical protein